MKMEVVTGFTAQKVYINRRGLRPMIIGAQIRYEWDKDRLEYVSTGLGRKLSYKCLPHNGELTYSLMLGYKCRLLVKPIIKEIEMIEPDEDLRMLFDDEEFL